MVFPTGILRLPFVGEAGVSDWLARFVVAVVVASWFMTSIVLPLMVQGYTAPPEINTVMGIVAGGAVAFIFAKRGENGRKPPEDPAEPDEPDVEENGRSIHERALERGREAREQRLKRRRPR